jgi:hypothetical protein
MAVEKTHERLRDCLCSWVVEPIRVQYGYEQEGFELAPERVMTSVSYVRNIVHHINPKCPPHGWLLSPVRPMGQLLPKISNIAVEAVPLADRPAARVSFENSQEG